MKKKADTEPTKEQIRNMKYSEERLQLLEALREMVNEEFSRRRMEEVSNMYLKNPIPARIDPKPPEKMPPRCPVWQWFVNLFNIDSHSHGTKDRPLDMPDKLDNHNARASDTALLRKEFQQGGNTNSHEKNTTKRTTSTVRKHKAKG